MLTANKNLYKLILIAWIFFPAIIFSASIQVETKSNVIHVGDTVVLDVVMDTEKTTLNLVEGSIKISNNKTAVEVLEISLSGSPLTLWPNKPSISADGSVTSFVGGTPNGFNSNNSGLFKLILVAKSPGKVVLDPFQIKAYLNDGKGTAVSVKVKSTEITILEADSNMKSVNEWTTILSEDKIPPEKFTISLGQDASVYDNQKFISFNAEDIHSGIDYYEVKEGDLDKVRSSNTYVLKDQNKDQVIMVSAIDKSGNVRTIEFRNTDSPNIRIILIVIALSFSVLFLIARMINSYLKRSKNK